MSRRLLPISVVVMTSCLLAQPSAQAGWMWSPQTGWIGPGGATKDTPEEQLAFAVAFFDKADYDRARKEFTKLLKTFRESAEAAEAQYYLGRCHEELDDYYQAFLEYRKTLQTYPSTKRFEDILEREYQLGNYFLGGKRRKVFGTAAILPARDKAVEIFQAIVEDGPFSEYGPLAQYKLGLAHLSLGDYEQAVEAFDSVIAKYPESPLVDDAKFQRSMASLKGTFRPGYDQAPTDTAIRGLQEFVRAHPEGDLAREATERVDNLREQRAAHEFQVGQFYERRRQPAAALVYYQVIVEQYADTSWGPKAAERIGVLGAQTK